MLENIFNWFKTPKIYCFYCCTGLAYNNTNFYIKAISSLANQRYKNYKIVISACCCEPNTINNLKIKFPNIDICKINDKLPVNITFNHTVKETIKKYGPADGYLFHESGVDFESNKKVLKTLSKYLKNPRYSIISPQIDPNTKNISEFLTDYEVPTGKLIPLICQIFSHQFYEAYNNILPDIFKGMYTEETFTFMVNALKTKFVILKDLKINHTVGLDGTAVMAECTPFERNGGKLWKQPFVLDEEEFYNRLISDKAREVGLGYCEALKISMHDPTWNYPNEHENPYERLKEYIKSNLFLKPSEFDYNNINWKWI